MGAGLNKAAARDVVDGVFEVIGEAPANGDEVRIAGFGTFSVKRRPGRTGRHSRTDEAISVSASKSPVVQGREDTQGRSERRREPVPKD